uniref:Hexosyltransferase n=1 Tax=Mesocestoides corti TaxID=53468 RepID=A0A5K3G307_MESCO
MEWARRATEARERALAEADEFGDMIIGDYVDTYVNLTYKLIMSHRWASAFCQGRPFRCFARYRASHWHHVLTSDVKQWHAVE